MKRKQLCLLIFFALICTAYCYSQTTSSVNITIEISNIKIDGGKVYFGIFSSEENFQNDIPYLHFFELDDSNTIMFQEINLPSGEYLISAFQDTNDNKQLDVGLFGIPKELLGMSNYFGRGFPSRNFDRHKIVIDEKNSIIKIGLFKI
jgi:uncharacterized protein (DUF2141 family)